MVAQSRGETVQVERSGQLLDLFWKESRWDSQDMVGGEEWMRDTQDSGQLQGFWPEQLGGPFSR